MQATNMQTTVARTVYTQLTTEFMFPVLIKIRNFKSPDHLKIVAPALVLGDCRRP